MDNANAWNALVERGNPFMRHEFLQTLEDTGCTGAGAAWQPMFVTHEVGGKLTGAIPAYLRTDSYGEYIFDWAWANAYEQGGLSYYPKITVAAPFTPATGKRILTGETFDRNIASHMLAQLEKTALQQRVSGIHFLCTTLEEQEFLSEMGYIPRLTHQYHWINHGFSVFDDYLSELRSHRRKEIKRERKKCSELGLTITRLTGEQILEEHMRAMYDFYVSTYDRKWGSPYLNLETFLQLRATMAQSLMLCLAHDGQQWVAGALAFRQDDRLYGRYWGARGHYPHLHFELCMYQLIEFAIEEKITLFEAGAQGEHKFQRGFAAMPVYSSHRLFHPGGSAAIADFLKRERAATQQLLDTAKSQLPLIPS